MLHSKLALLKCAKIVIEGENFNIFYFTMKTCVINNANIYFMISSFEIDVTFKLHVILIKHLLI